MSDSPEARRAKLAELQGRLDFLKTQAAGPRPEPASFNDDPPKGFFEQAWASMGATPPRQTFPATPSLSPQPEVTSDEARINRIKRVHAQFPGCELDYIAVTGYLMFQDSLGEKSPWRSPQEMRRFLTTEWRGFWGGIAAISIALSLMICAAIFWPWWSFIPILLLAAWGVFVVYETVNAYLFRADMGRVLRQTKIIDIIKPALIMSSIGLIELVGFWSHTYVNGSHGIADFFWRLSFAVEAAIAVAGIVLMLLAWEFESSRIEMKWGQYLSIGFIVFSLTAIAAPLLAGGVDHVLSAVGGRGWISRADIPREAAIGLAYLLVSATLIGASFFLYKRTVFLDEETGEPQFDITKYLPFLLRLPGYFVFLRRMVPKTSPRVPPQDYQQPTQHFTTASVPMSRSASLPSIRMPSLHLSASTMASWWFAIAFMAYAICTRMTGDLFGPDYHFLGFPQDDRINNWYICGAVMAVCLVLFWRARKRITTHELRNLKLLGLCVVQVLVGMAISVQAVHRIDQPVVAQIVDDVSLAMVIAGIARFFLLLRNPIKATGWRKWV